MTSSPLPPKTLPLSIPVREISVVLIGQGPAFEAKKRLLQSLDLPFREFEGEAAFPDEAQVRGAKLFIIAYSGQAAMNRAINLAQGLGAWVNVVDRPELCDVHIPAIAERGALRIGLATGGTMPALASHLRQKLETLLPESDHIALFERAAPQIRAACAEPYLRRRVWDRLFASDHLVDFATQRDIFQDWLIAQIADPDLTTGRQDVITLGEDGLKALSPLSATLMRQADLVIAGSVTNLTRYMRREAELISPDMFESEDSLREAMDHAASTGLWVVRIACAHNKSEP